MYDTCINKMKYFQYVYVVYEVNLQNEKKQMWMKRNILWQLEYFKLYGKEINKFQRGMIWMIMGVKEVMGLKIQRHFTKQCASWSTWIELSS